MPFGCEPHHIIIMVYQSACLETSSVDQTVEDVDGCERSSAQQAF